MINAVIMLSFAIGICSLPFDLVVAPWWMPIEDIGSATLFLSAMLLNRVGKFTLARITALACGNLIMIVNCALMGASAGAHLVFFALAILPFVLFDEDERGWLIFFVATSVASFFVFECGAYSFLAGRIQPYAFGGYFIYSAVIAFAILLTTVLHFVRSNLRSESALRASEEHYRMVTAIAQDAILTVDAKSELIFASPSSERVFGIAPAELIGHRLDDLLPGWSSASSVGQARTGVHPVRGEFPVEVSVGESSEAPGIQTVIVRDVTERVRNQLLLDETRARSQFAAKLAALGEMSGGVAHEINNPLTALTLAAEHLLRVSDDGKLEAADVRYTAERIQRITDRIDKIVSALRYFARDAERDPMERTAVKQLVADTVELCTERFRKHQIEFRLAPVPPDMFLECRAVQISQVLLNLLSNAHDAVEGVKGAWVRLEVESRGDDLVFAVTDSNQGISDAVRAKIFQPFFTTKDIGKGTGLGLSVSHGIVTEHRGRIELDVEAPNTRFVVTLPVRAAKSAPAVDVTN